MERDFARAAISSARPVIMGVRMMPFSVGHRALLEDVESCFVTGATPTYGDIVSAGVICAHGWKENQELRESNFKRWLTCRVWGLLAKFDPLEEMRKLKKYVEDGNAFPDTIPPKDGKRLAAPHLSRLYLFLRRLGFSDVESFDCPLVFANMIYAADLESEGKIELQNDDFKEMIRRSYIRK